jgi:2'-5' RNA ligase
VRLFFAVEIPAETRSALARLQSADPAYRWVEPGQLHVTLAFLGEQSEALLPTLELVGATTAAHGRSGTLRLGEPGSFGPHRAPRVLWIGLAGDVAKLTHLQETLADQLTQHGFPTEDRDFRPHITLARHRPNATGSSQTAWPPRDLRPNSSFALDHLTLFQSRLSPRGATYIPLGQYPLGA